MNENLPVWLKDMELAKVLNVSVSTVREWRYHPERQGPIWVKVGGAVRYRVSDLKAWMKSCERESQPFTQ